MEIKDITKIQFDEKLLYWIQKIPHQEIKDGKNLLELTTYNKISFWRFVERNLFDAIEIIINSNRKQLKFTDLTRWQEFLLSNFEFFYDLITCILGKLLAKKIKTPFSKKILITAQNREWKFLPILNKKVDAFYYPVMEELKKEFTIITTYPIYYPISGLKIALEKKLLQRDIFHKPFNSYWGFRIWQEEKKAKKHFKKLWHRLIKEKKFKNLWVYEGFNFFPFLKGILANYFIKIFPRVVKYIEMSKRLIRNEKPDLILLQYEYGKFEKALIVAGKLNNIPTLAIQHGNIYYLDKAYRFLKGEISSTGSIFSPFAIAPDKTAVWGPYFYNLLTKKGNYPPEKVEITGQPKYDILRSIDRKFDKKNFCRQYGLNVEKKIILICTENLPVFEQNIKFLKIVLEGVKNFSNIQIILKPHPNERINWYKKVIEEQRVKIVILPKNIEALVAIYNSDLIIACYSTVITEAILLKKPVIVVDLLGLSSKIPYYEYRVVNKAISPSDLSSMVEKIFHDESEKEKFEKMREKFICDFFLEIDGKSTERLTKLVRKMIKDKNLPNNTCQEF